MSNSDSISLSNSDSISVSNSNSESDSTSASASAAAVCPSSCEACAGSYYTDISAFDGACGSGAFVGVEEYVRYPDRCWWAPQATYFDDDTVPAFTLFTDVGVGLQCGTDYAGKWSLYFQMFDNNTEEVVGWALYALDAQPCPDNIYTLVDSLGAGWPETILVY